LQLPLPYFSSLAVNFMGAVFVRGTENLLQYGAGIALPIAALGLFVGLRAWSVKLNVEATLKEERQSLSSKPTRASHEQTEEQ